MEFEVHHRRAGTPGVSEIRWTEWTRGAYKIVCYHEGEYYAYYKDAERPMEAPDIVPCRGCRDTYCDGYHKAWSTLDKAIDSCIEHAAQLPW